jgi:hypothetical protein
METNRNSEEAREAKMADESTVPKTEDDIDGCNRPIDDADATPDMKTCLPQPEE